MSKPSSQCLYCGRSFIPYRQTAGKFCSYRCSQKGRTQSIEDRFWKNVYKTEHCWFWIGYTSKDGYGKMSHYPKHGCAMRSHRASWIIHKGPIPASVNVLHHCDNRLCVRPTHLFLGTHLQNTKDRVSKGVLSGRARKLIVLSIPRL